MGAKLGSGWPRDDLISWRHVPGAPLVSYSMEVSEQVMMLTLTRARYSPTKLHGGPAAPKVVWIKPTGSTILACLFNRDRFKASLSCCLELGLRGHYARAKVMTWRSW